MVVPFAITGTFIPRNIFFVQLSDVNGFFTYPVTIGSLAGTGSGSVLANIPDSIRVETFSRIRVVSSNPAIIGTNNGENIAIRTRPEQFSISRGGGASMVF